MARQSGPIKFEGSMGNVTFYKHKNGNYYARQKSQISKKRFKNAPEFEGSRCAGYEFGRASQISRLIRHGLVSNLKDIEKLGHSKLTGIIQKVIQSDPISGRGERKFYLGNYRMIDGLELGKDFVLSILGGKPLISLLDSGKKVGFDFSHLGLVQVPKMDSPITHYSTSIFAVKIGEDSEITGEKLEFAFPLTNVSQPVSGIGSQMLEYSESKDENQIILTAIGIRFYQEVNGRYFILQENGGVVISGV